MKPIPSSRFVQGEGTQPYLPAVFVPCPKLMPRP